VESIQYKYRIDHSNIPKEYFEYTWSKYDPEADMSGSGGVSGKVIESRKNAYNVAKKFAKNIKKNVENGRSLIIIGKSSTGKTVLATLILRHSARILGNRILYVDFSEFFYQMSRLNINEEIMADYSEADILLLDEIYSEDSNPAAKDAFRGNMGRVLRFRRANRKTTILTSRININNIKDIFGESSYRIISDKNYFNSPIIIAEQESDLKIEILNPLNKFDANDIVRRIERITAVKRSDIIDADLVSRILKETMVN